MKTMLKFIINPKAKRKITQGILDKRLNGISYSVAVTSRAGEATEIAAKAVREGFTKVVAVGGDGTINEVINGIMGSGVPLGIIPTGGANDLAGYLKIPKSIDKALDIIMNGSTEKIDLIKVNNRCFVTVGGLGIGTEVALKVNKLKANRLGKLMYALLGSNIYRAYALYQILFKPEIQRKAYIKGEEFENDIALWGLFAGNQPVVGKNFMLHPGASNNDGLLDICLVKGMNGKLRQLTTLFTMMKGDHMTMSHIKTFKTRDIIIQCEKSSHFFGDGELISDSPPYHIRIIPEALAVMVPRRR